MKRAVYGVLGVLAIVYGVAAGYVALNQRDLIFRIDPSPPQLAASGLRSASEMTLTTADGVTLAGWTVAPARADAPVIVYFPGNARTRANRAPRFRLLTETGAGLVAFEHRGYGGSGGEPSEAALLRDAREIYALAQKTFPGHRLVLFGESLGSGIASQLASEVEAAALILDSAFLSMQSLASERYPWIPVGLLLRHPFRSDQAIGRVRAPVLMLHGDRDTLVPLESGRALFEKIVAPKEMKIYPGARHVAAFSFGALEDVRRFLAEKAGITL